MTKGKELPMSLAVYVMVYLGSALMVYNIWSYVRYTEHVSKKGDWGSEARILYIPIVLLSFFLLGYLGIGIFGNPDLLVASILFGGSIFVCIIFRLIDRITKRIQENEQLEASLMAARQSNANKTSFLASVSHEMRTPMNAIVGLDTLALANPDLSDVTRNQLTQIGLSAQYLQSLINNVLDMSGIESGELQLKAEPFALGKILEQVNVIIRVQCDQKGLTYHPSVAAGMDTRFVGDGMRVRQVLLSVLQNAVKFTPEPGSVTFVTEQIASDGERRTLRFTVTDTGIGMDQEFIPKLFEAFMQEDATTTNRYGGSGLGLALTKRLVDLMDGDIEVVSAKGAGSTFRITMTLGACAEPEAPEPEAGAEQAAAEEPLGPVGIAGKRVLVVDDIDLNAEILEDLLDLEEAATDRAENGQVAVDLFRQSEVGYYDAVLMDLRMPVMDGFDATRAIRALDRPDAQQVPILAVTANVGEEDQRKALEAGMNVHLAKPVDADELYATLGMVIAQGGRKSSGEEA